MFSLRIHSAEHVWIRARFPKTREWSSDWTKVGMSEQEVSFGFCLSHCDTIANICSWVHSENWTACLDANKIQQVHSNKVNKKRNELYRDFWMCVVVMLTFSSRAGACPSMLWKPWGASTTKASEVAYGGPVWWLLSLRQWRFWKVLHITLEEFLRNL